MILAKVSRLFGPYTGGARTARRRSVAGPGPAQLHSYTHLFCCLVDKNADLVPNRNAKYRLAAAGLGEKRLTFRGMSDIMMTTDTIQSMIDTFVPQCISNNVYKFVIQTELIRIEIACFFVVRHNCLPEVVEGSILKLA